MMDVNYGWVVRYCHSNGAAFFFIFVYAHMARGIYYGSYRAPRIAVWYIGVVIFLLMIITGFLGYKNNSLTMYNTYKKRFNNINSLVLKRGFSLRTNSLFTNQIRYNLNDSSLNIRYYSTNTNNNKYDELFNELKINPIYHFDNLDNLNTRISILNTVKGLSGIYIVINKVTKNYYIGSAITNRFGVPDPIKKKNFFF